jgi:general secretion pathway protein L
MSDRLLIRLQADGQLTWLAQDAQGRALSGANAGVPTPATIASARHVIALVPSEQVVLLEADAARAGTSSPGPCRRAEDQLASPVEELHFALSERCCARLGVAVVARTVLRDWIQMLEQLGVRADAIVPTLAVPVPSDAAAVLIEPTERCCAGATLPGVCETAALGSGSP